MPKTLVRRRKAPIKGQGEKQPTVLAVEDSATQAEALLAALGEGGFEVTLARSGDDALRILGERAFDLVISDIVMPGDVDGYELCRRIKAGPHRETPVVLLTSLSDPMDIIHGLEAGADNFLTKPYEPEHLLERLAVLLATRRARARGRVRAGVTVYFMGRQFTITSEREQILDLLVSTFEDAVRQNRELREREAQLARSRETLAGLYRIAVSLNACTTEDQIIQTALDHALLLPAVRAGWIWLQEGEGTALRLAGSRNLPRALAKPGAMEGDCLCRRMLLAGQLDQVTNILECERLKGTAGPLRVHATVPLHCGGRRLGVLNLVGEGQGMFSEEDLTVLYGVGNQIAYALERARLWNRLEQLVEQRTAALREREHQLSSIYDTVVDVIFHLAVEDDGRYRFASVNPAFCSVTGLRYEDVIGKRVDEVIPEPALTQVTERYAEAISGKRAVRWEETSQYPTGTLTGEVTIAPVFDEAGKCTHLVGSVHNITERKRAEEALQESEHHYRSLFDNMLNGFAYCRMLLDQGRPQDFVYLAVNGAFERLTGLKDVVGKKVSEVIPGIRESDPELLESYGRVVRTGVPETFETYVAALKMWFAISVYRPRDEHFVAVFDVITDRKRTEEALRLSDSILRQVGNLVVVSDRDGLVRYASPSVQAALGYSPDDVLGNGWWELTFTVPEQRDAERALAARAARGETAPRTMPYEREVRARDGSTRLTLWSDSKGPGDLLIGVGYDITDTRRLEEQFRQAQKMEAVGRLAGGVAHDFNNILTAIIGYSDLLLATPSLEHQARNDLAEIRAAADRAARLTKQLLAFSRKQVLQPQLLSLNQAVSGLEAMLRRLLGEDITLAVVLAPDLGTVEADPGQLEQVVMNLAVNARDAMPQGGKLTIETRNVDLDQGYAETHSGVTPGAYVLLAVSDTGHGMDPTVKAHLFEPFFTTKERGQGTGLGLATVHGIVHQSGGHIWVYSEPGHGTAFKIYLPRLSEGAVPFQREPEPSGLSTGTETVLLVEDDPGVRNLVATTLTKCGYHVLQAEDGAAAAEVARSHEGLIHLLLTDVVMPGISGRSTAESLLRLRPEVKVLYMSGYTDDAITRHGILEPGIHLIQKPFTPGALARKVREALDEPTEQL